MVLLDSTKLGNADNNTLTIFSFYISAIHKNYFQMECI